MAKIASRFVLRPYSGLLRHAHRNMTRRSTSTIPNQPSHWRGACRNGRCDQNSANDEFTGSTGETRRSIAVAIGWSCLIEGRRMPGSSSCSVRAAPSTRQSTLLSMVPLNSGGLRIRIPYAGYKYASHVPDMGAVRSVRICIDKLFEPCLAAKYIILLRTKLVGQAPFRQDHVIVCQHGVFRNVAL